MGVNYFNNVGEPLIICNFIVNFFFTLLTLYTIIIINKNEGYMFIVFYLTISQCIYELVNLLEFYLSEPAVVTFLNSFMTKVTGLMCSFFPFLICCLLSYVIITRKYFDIIRYKNKLSISILFMSVLLSSFIYYFKLSVNQRENYEISYGLYYWIRLIIPFLTILMLSITYYYILELNLQLSPIGVLFKRLSLYPIVAVISRLPIWYYQYRYEQGLYDYAYSINPDSFETIMFFVAAVTYPVAGNLYIIFINYHY
jgi:hypothetical protein